MTEDTNKQMIAEAVNIHDIGSTDQCVKRLAKITCKYTIDAALDFSMARARGKIQGTLEDRWAQ